MRVVAFYNQRGKAEQYIEGGKNAINWTRLSGGFMGFYADNVKDDGQRRDLIDFLKEPDNSLNICLGVYR